MVMDWRHAGAVEALWHTLIDTESGVVPGRYGLEDLVVSVHRNPSVRGEDLVYVPWALSVARDGAVILVVQIEQDDLRNLAFALGCPVRELQEERGVKGFFGQPRVYAYAEGEREDLGPYDGPMDEKTVRRTLLDWACDILDLISSPVPLG